MKVSLRELKTKITKLTNILNQADKGGEKEQSFLMSEAKLATHDLLDMECDIAKSIDVSTQIEMCKRGLKFIGEE